MKSICWTILGRNIRTNLSRRVVSSMDMEWLNNADLVIGCHNQAKLLVNGATANWTLVDSGRAN